MNRQSAIWKRILENLENNIQVMLLYVLESKGSSPGRQGFSMMINGHGDIYGSIGGGIMEHKFVELAKEKLSNATNDFESSEIKKQYHDKSAVKDQSGMICSGEQTILFYHVKPEDKIVLSNLVACIDENKNGQLAFSPGGMEFLDKIPDKNYHFELQSDDNWLYQEKLGYKNHLYIIGGGHCSLAFSKLMADLDFYIHLYDHRSGLNTMEENEFVHEKHLLNDYGELSTLVKPGANHYVVIMTLGYRSDDRALRALLNKDFKYIGLLGSETKIQKMFADLKKDGINEDRIKKIHSPIGLQIHSQTPEEIAISIAGEIIMVKNGLREKEL
jgi:xanthine dehydrogenase accessory factor